MKYIDAEKLKEKINRRLDELNPKAGMLGDMSLRSVNPNTFPRESELEKVLYLIDSLQQEQPTFPSNLDEAAEEYADYNSQRWHEGGDVYYDHSKIIDAFKAGAEWMAEQGETIEGEIVKDINNRLAVTAKGLSCKEFKFGETVIVQIRKI